MPRLQSQDNVPADFPGNVFLNPDFVRHYRGPWIWPFPRPPMAKADIYGATLQADTYSEAARDALRAGDDAAVLNALEVQAGVIAVVIERLRGSSSENLRKLQ
jgi:hypothetical protein